MEQDSVPVIEGEGEKEDLEPIEVEEADGEVATVIGDDEPMEECVNTASPKQPSSLRSEDVVMAENLSVSLNILIKVCVVLKFCFFLIGWFWNDP